MSVSGASDNKYIQQGAEFSKSVEKTEHKNGIAYSATVDGKNITVFVKNSELKKLQKNGQLETHLAKTAGKVSAAWDAAADNGKLEGGFSKLEFKSDKKFVVSSEGKNQASFNSNKLAKDILKTEDLNAAMGEALKYNSKDSLKFKPSQERKGSSEETLTPTTVPKNQNVASEEKAPIPPHRDDYVEPGAGPPTPSRSLSESLGMTRPPTPQPKTTAENPLEVTVSEHTGKPQVVSQEDNGKGEVEEEIQEPETRPASSNINSEADYEEFMSKLPSYDKEESLDEESIKDTATRPMTPSEQLRESNLSKTLPEKTMQAPVFNRSEEKVPKFQGRSLNITPPVAGKSQAAQDPNVELMQKQAQSAHMAMMNRMDSLNSPPPVPPRGEVKDKIAPPVPPREEAEGEKQAETIPFSKEEAFRLGTPPAPPTKAAEKTSLKEEYEAISKAADEEEPSSTSKILTSSEELVAAGLNKPLGANPLTAPVFDAEKGAVSSLGTKSVNIETPLPSEPKPASNFDPEEMSRKMREANERLRKQLGQ